MISALRSVRYDLGQIWGPESGLGRSHYMVKLLELQCIHERHGLIVTVEVVRGLSSTRGYGRKNIWRNSPLQCASDFLD